MAATITLDSGPDGRSVTGDRQIRRGKLNVGVYPTNGAAVTKTDFDLFVSLNDLQIQPSTGYTFEFDKTNSKIKAFRTGAVNTPGEEVPNTTNLTAIEPRFRAEGR